MFDRKWILGGFGVGAALLLATGSQGAEPLQVKPLVYQKTTTATADANTSQAPVQEVAWRRGWGYGRGWYGGYGGWGGRGWYGGGYRGWGYGGRGWYGGYRPYYGGYGYGGGYGYYRPRYYGYGYAPSYWGYGGGYYPGVSISVGSYGGYYGGYGYGGYGYGYAPYGCY